MPAAVIAAITAASQKMFGKDHQAVLKIEIDILTQCDWFIIIGFCSICFHLETIA